MLSAMTGLTPNAHTAISEIAAVLADSITNAIIDAAAEGVGLASTRSNKVDKLRELVSVLWMDGRRRSQAEKILVSLTMEAHSRALQGKCSLYVEDVDRIVTAMRRLELRTNALAVGVWRKGLKRKAPPIAAPSAAPIDTARAGAQHAARVHTLALEHIQEMSGGGIHPQSRGRQLELIVLDILQAERLFPEHRVTSPGEEIDLAFALEGHHFLIECKWEKDPIGLQPVRVFRDKVMTKAEGTFGVFLSMSGFVHDINDKVSRGQRLSAIGLSHAHLMNVVEGRVSWARTVHQARLHASRTAAFFVPP